jgi:hypothetical protein
LFRFGLVWSGLVWFGLVWFGLMWPALVYFDGVSFVSHCLVDCYFDYFTTFYRLQRLRNVERDDTG